MDEDWHAICQAIHKVVGRADWENSHYKFVDMNKEINVRNPGGSNRAKMFGRCTKPRWDVGTTTTRPMGQQEWCVKQLQKALTGALWRVEEWEEADSSTAGGSRT